MDSMPVNDESPYRPLKAKLRSIAEATGHPYLSLSVVNAMMRELADQCSYNKSWYPSPRHVNLLLRSICPYTILPCDVISDKNIAPRIDGLIDEISLKGLIPCWHDYGIGHGFVIASDPATATFLKLALAE